MLNEWIKILIDRNMLYSICMQHSNKKGCGKKSILLINKTIVIIAHNMLQLKLYSQFPANALIGSSS